MKKRSELTGIEYDTKDVVAIYNPAQYGKYVSRGADIMDCGTDENDRFYLVFDRAATKSLFDAWCKHEL